MKKQDIASSVAVMFEDLKQCIIDLGAKIEKSKNTVFTGNETSSIDKNELLQLIREQRAEDAFHTKKVIAEELEGFENRLTLKLNNGNKGESHLQVTKYPYFANVKTGILSLTFIVMFTLLLWGFVSQWIENSNLSQNDLKYRYIKIYGEIDHDAFQRLEKFFKDGNPQSIRNFRLEVEKWEAAETRKY